MTRENILQRLKSIQDLILDTGRVLNDEEYRTQYHEDLSPLGWHVGHCAFVETYWIRQVCLGDDSITDDLRWLYVPENILKPERGPALPEHQTHLKWCANLHQENLSLLAKPPATLRQHSLYNNNYLALFILQHHCQHYETMAMVLTQLQLQKSHQHFTVKAPIKAQLPDNDAIAISAGEYHIGNQNNAQSFDNEVPAQKIHLDDFQIAKKPISNAQWLAFMENGGYQQTKLWDEAGWVWKESKGISHPENWRKDKQQNWYGINTEGPYSLDPSAPVNGINYFEANAFVKWCREIGGPFRNARLPHEYELEVSSQTDLLEQSKHVWEWCKNQFHAYPNFTAFPYDEYSKPWFDGNHYTLRGASAYTQSDIQRASFRNFYNPDKRHIFSGLRLAL